MWIPVSLPPHHSYQRYASYVELVAKWVLSRPSSLFAAGKRSTSHFFLINHYCVHNYCVCYLRLFPCLPINEAIPAAWCIFMTLSRTVHRLFFFFSSLIDGCIFRSGQNLKYRFMALMKIFIGAKIQSPKNYPVKYESCAG